MRPAPEGYIWCHSVSRAIKAIEAVEKVKLDPENQWHNFDDIVNWEIELIDIDHDAGEYAQDGGDYIKLLDWLEETGRNYPIHIHSMNSVGVANMKAIIQKNGWKEVDNMSIDLKKDIISAAGEASEFSKTLSSSQCKLNKEEAILRLVESLNIGGEEAEYQRVDIAFIQYEQIQRKLREGLEF